MSPISKPRRTTRATYQGHGILVGRIEHEQRLWHGMKDHHAFVVPELGSWEFLYRGRAYRQTPGVIQLKQPGEMYCDLRREGPATYDTVIFDPALLTDARVSSTRASEVVFATPQLAANDRRAAALLALRGAVEVAREHDELAIETAIAEAALVLVSLGTTQREVGHESRRVQRAKAYLRDRLTERIRLDEVADHVGIDKYHLIRSFRAQVGVPPYEYLTHARVHRARELLRAGVAAGTAATTVGFCDQSQLHRHFVRLVGMTPGRYAASARASRRSGGLGVEYGILAPRRFSRAEESRWAADSASDPLPSVTPQEVPRAKESRGPNPTSDPLASVAPQEFPRAKESLGPHPASDPLPSVTTTAQDRPRSTATR